MLAGWWCWATVRPLFSDSPPPVSVEGRSNLWRCQSDISFSNLLCGFVNLQRDVSMSWIPALPSWFDLEPEFNVDGGVVGQRRNYGSAVNHDIPPLLVALNHLLNQKQRHVRSWLTEIKNRVLNCMFTLPNCMFCWWARCGWSIEDAEAESYLNEGFARVTVLFARINSTQRRVARKLRINLNTTEMQVLVAEVNTHCAKQMNKKNTGWNLRESVNIVEEIKKKKRKGFQKWANKRRAELLDGRVLTLVRSVWPSSDHNRAAAEVDKGGCTERTAA